MADEIFRDPLHNDQMVAVYATAIRLKGKIDGKAIGVLGVFFDWEQQAKIIVEKEPSFSQEEWIKNRVMLLDQKLRIIGTSDKKDYLETFPLSHNNQQKGYYFNDKKELVAFAKTIGYQEYDGLGWWAVIVRQP